MIYIIFLTLTILIVSFNGAYAQYGNESATSYNASTLQEEVNVYTIQEEKKQEIQRQTQDFNTSIALMETGIPMGVLVSVGVVLFSKKK